MSHETLHEESARTATIIAGLMFSVYILPLVLVLLTFVVGMFLGL